jgi:hypothetical protein
LRRRKLARLRPHLLFKVRQSVGNLLPILDHLVEFLRGGILRRLARRASRVHLRHQIAYLIGLLLLLSRHLLGFFLHRVEAAGRVLLLRSTQESGRFTQTLGRAARIGSARIRRGGPLHVFVGLAQTIQRLLSRLLTAVGGLLR